VIINMDMNDFLNENDLGHTNDAVDAGTGNRSGSLETSLRDMLLDAYKVTCDTNSKVYAIATTLTTLCARVTVIEDELRQIKSSASRTQAIVTSSPHNDENNGGTGHSRDAQNTKKVSTDVVAAVIRSVWYREHPSATPLPVGMAYLAKLCHVNGEFRL
jgi:hypothetical protein